MHYLHLIEPEYWGVILWFVKLPFWISIWSQKWAYLDKVLYLESDSLNPIKGEHVSLSKMHLTDAFILSNSDGKNIQVKIRNLGSSRQCFICSNDKSITGAEEQIKCWLGLKKRVLKRSWNYRGSSLLW